MANLDKEPHIFGLVYFEYANIPPIACVLQLTKLHMKEKMYKKCHH